MRSPRSRLGKRCAALVCLWAGALCGLPASAHRSPAGCNGNGVVADLQGPSSGLSGQPVQFTLYAGNLDDSFISLVACDADDIDLLLFCPDADGMPDHNNPIIVQTDLVLPAGTATMMVTTRNCVLNVNPGVTSAIVEFQLGDRSGALDMLTEGTLHDTPAADHPFRSSKQRGIQVVSSTTTSTAPTSSSTSSTSTSLAPSTSTSSTSTSSSTTTVTPSTTTSTSSTPTSSSTTSSTATPGTTTPPSTVTTSTSSTSSSTSSTLQAACGDGTVTPPERCDPGVPGSELCCNPASCLPVAAGNSCGLELDECGIPICNGAGVCITKPVLQGFRCRDPGNLGPCDPGAVCGVQPNCPNVDTASGCEALNFTLAANAARLKFRCQAKASARGGVKCSADLVARPGSPLLARRRSAKLQALPASDCTGPQFDTTLPKKLSKIGKSELARLIVARINKADRGFFDAGKTICVRVRFTAENGYSQTRLYDVMIPAAP